MAKQSTIQKDQRGTPFNFKHAKSPLALQVFLGILKNLSLDHAKKAMFWLSYETDGTFGSTAPPQSQRKSALEKVVNATSTMHNLFDGQRESCKIMSAVVAKNEWYRVSEVRGAEIGRFAFIFCSLLIISCSQ
jgi:hypothetical protein